MSMKLFRPVGPEELRLVEESGWKRFPPRLPEQPFFYPVCNVIYAEKIARDWNVPSSGSGFVLEFEVSDDFISKYQRQIVGSKEHEEYWIPAEDMDDFNSSIVGKIELIRKFTVTSGATGI